MASAERSQISLTAFTPVQVLKITGKAETKATSSTADLLPRPNQSRNNGAYAMPGIGAPMLTSGSSTSSARREWPMANPMRTPATAAQTNPANRRRSVSTTGWGRVPDAVRRTRADATSSSGGNRRGGKMPRWAATSHIAPTTRNGNAVRPTIRQRLSPSGGDAAAIGTVADGAATVSDIAAAY